MNCKFCGTHVAPGLLYFCSKHWMEIPGAERAKIRAMHVRKQDMTSKLEKAVRILREKHTLPLDDNNK
jgi:hypothetical protein